jgi:hypothetical protein
LVSFDTIYMSKKTRYFGDLNFEPRTSQIAKF